jgi:redox-sensitive bicupin YhaK (pirin superfamily)
MKLITGSKHDLGDGLVVQRVLPQAGQRRVGPFVFFDYIGPAVFAPGKGIDVRPHPHIGLATVTYLFDGSQMHRDSIGSVQEITPGDVNWMTSGRGIVHSERTGPETRAKGHRLHGIQSWIGLPVKDEEAEPNFQHVACNELPTAEKGGVTLRLITGSAYGLTSPVQVFSPIFYVDAQFPAGARLPMTDEHEERAAFVVDGEVEIGGTIYREAQMIVFDKGEAATITAKTKARVMLLGGAALDGERHIWWNFVASSRERMERAKEDWKAMRFGTIPGDDKEFIPLPPDKPSPVPQFE